MNTRKLAEAILHKIDNAELFWEAGEDIDTMTKRFNLIEQVLKEELTQQPQDKGVEEEARDFLYTQGVNHYYEDWWVLQMVNFYHHMNAKKGEGVEQIAPLIIRPELMWFVKQMELKLRENDHKGGWRSMSRNYLSRRITDEKKELSDAFEKDIPSRIIRECADIANFAMMIADNEGDIKTFSPTQPPQDKGVEDEAMKIFKTGNIRNILMEWYKDKMSTSRVAELLNGIVHHHMNAKKGEGMEQSE